MANLQVMPLEENMSRVQQGMHMFLTWKYYISVIIGGKYSNARGVNPFHISKHTYLNFGGYAWGTR